MVVAWVVGGGDEEEEDGEEEEDSVLAALPCSTPSATRTTKLQARSCFPHGREEHLGEAIDGRARRRRPRDGECACRDQIAARLLARLSLPSRGICLILHELAPPWTLRR